MASKSGYKDRPLSHQGSGGPGDDRQDNSSASQGTEDSKSNPESTPGTDKHRGESSTFTKDRGNTGDAGRKGDQSDRSSGAAPKERPEASAAGPEMSESDPE